MTKVDEIAYQDLEKINGKDWQKRYEIDVAEEFRRDSAIIAKVELLDSIKAKDNELKKTNNGLHFYVDSALNNDTYRVNVTGYLVPTTDYVSYYRVYYNFSKLKVDSFDNKILFMFKGK